jgi:hypothetical protein
MAKTKLILEIQTHAKKADDHLTSLEHYLTEYLQYDHPLTPALKEVFGNAQAEMTALGASITRMDQHIQAWNGKAKLKNLFKSKAKLQEARNKANNQFGALKTDYVNLKALFTTVEKLYGDLAATDKSQALHN